MGQEKSGPTCSGPQNLGCKPNPVDGCVHLHCSPCRKVSGDNMRKLFNTWLLRSGVTPPGRLAALQGLHATLVGLGQHGGLPGAAGFAAELAAQEAVHMVFDMLKVQ